MAKIFVCKDAERAKQTAENKKNLTSIVKTDLFCASNNILLREHSADKGNFMKLLQLCIDAGDEALKKHFAQMAGNAKYASPTIQNKILRIASTMMVEEFVAEANESFLSIVADKSCDISLFCFCFICHFYPPFTRKRIVSLYFGREVCTRLGVAFFEVYGPPVFHIKAGASR